MDNSLPSKKKNFWLLVLAGLLFLSGIVIFASSFNKEVLKTDSTKDISKVEASISGTLSETGQAAEVSRVIDGDTIEVDVGGNFKKVRYIGVDTPETVDPRRPVACFGKEASGENKKLVSGKRVILVKDISETDKYGRLLRYVYLEDERGQIFINDFLVREGFAKVMTMPPDVKFAKQFVEAQQQARESKLGLWAKCL